MSTSLFAIEPPKQNDQEPVVEPCEKGCEVAEVKVAWLGVAGDPISPALGMHLGLEKGLDLRVVVPDSPAHKAGFEAHDLILDINGEAIGSQHDLRTVIKKAKPGEELAVKFLRKGKTIEKKVALGERPQNMPQVPRFRRMKHMDGFPKDLLKNLPPDQQGQLEELLLKELNMEDLQDLPKQLDLEELMKGEGVAGAFMSSSITQFDADGSITLKTQNGKAEIEVKDTEGNIVFSGPYETDIDKDAVPDELKPRLEALNLDMKGGRMKLDFNLDK